MKALLKFIEKKEQIQKNIKPIKNYSEEDKYKEHENSDKEKNKTKLSSNSASINYKILINNEDFFQKFENIHMNTKIKLSIYS